LTPADANSMPAAPRGSGASLGEKVLRLSSIHSVGLLVNHGLTLVSAIVVAIFLGPADFGRYGLLLFAASFLSFIFNLGSKQGTMKRVFGGGDDDDEDEDDEDEDMAESRQRALGTGLVLTAIVSVIGTALFLVFADEVSGFLLRGNHDPALIVWAGIAGGFGAIIRLGSLAIWMEHRPGAYVLIDNLRPALALAISVPLLATGAGVSAAIGGYAAGSAAAAVATLLLLRGSFELCFEWCEALTILNRGGRRIPLVSSMWIVGYMDIFLLSRFVDKADIGVYHLASKAGFAVAFLPAGYRKALRPLRKTPAFHAVEDEYGAGTARGIQLGYFLIMLAGVLLAVSLGARALGRISPDGYGEAASLIPLLSAGLVAPTVYRMLSKTAKFKNKPRYFITGAVLAALVFIGACLLLIPPLGIWAPPIAMLIAFAIPALAITVKGQRGASPAVLPTRAFVVSFGSAILIGGAYYLIDPPGTVLEFIVPFLGMALWLALLPIGGAIPAAHRSALVQMAKGMFGRRGREFDERAVIEGLVPKQRHAAMLAISRRMPLDEVAPPGDPEEEGKAPHHVRTQRQFAADAGSPSGDKTRRDAQIGEYLFAAATPADRGAHGKSLMKSGKVDPGDLHELERILEHLRSVPEEAWQVDDGPAMAGTQEPELVGR
jgi:O-antigen/teichoic acid export membrane protein